MQTKNPIRHLLCLLLSLLLAMAALPAAAEEGESRRITLSGSAAETFTAQQNCYAESDRVLVFFPKGMSIPGDALAIIEGLMADLEQATGLSFDTRWSASHTNNYQLLYQEDVFDSVNPDGAKVEVLVGMLGSGSPYATENSAVVDVIDLADTDRLALYHELAHVLYLRNAVDLGLCLDEGLATWTLDRLYRQKGIPCYNTDFYMTDSGFDETLITGGEDGFRHTYERSEDNYCYGYRFVTFLTETYGEEIIPTLLKAATADGFDPSIGSDAAAETKADTEHMKRILKSVSGGDVFERFAAWHDSEMPRLLEEYNSYMAAAGGL